MNEEVNIEIHQISTELAVLSNEIKTLISQMTEIKLDIKEIKGVQSEKINTLEKEVALVKEKVERLDTLYKTIVTLLITGVVGGIVSLIFKFN